jgi:hypothetical protein
MAYHIVAVIGIAVALICGALTVFSQSSIVMVGLVLGMATAFLGFGLESIDEANKLGMAGHQKGKLCRGWVFIVAGLGLLALTVTNLLSAKH